MADLKAPALNPALVKQAEFVRNVWSVTIPPDVPMTSVLASDFWAHCSSKFKAYDKIECRAQDNRWYAELLVAKVERLAVRVWCVLYSDLGAQGDAAAKPDAVDYSVAFGGGHHKWRVVRASDKAVIHHGEASREDAQKWLDAFLTGQVQADPA